MGASLLSVPVSNLLSHIAGRTYVRNPALWRKPGLRTAKEFAESLVGASFRAGLEGKKVREGGLAALGALSPRLTSAMGVAHELGVKSKKLGLKSAADLEKHVAEAAAQLERAGKLGDKVRTAIGLGTPAAGAAVGALAGGAVARENKAPAALAGAGLGLAGGLAGGRSLSKAVGKVVGQIKKYEPAVGAFHAKTRGVVKELEAPVGGPVKRKLLNIFFK